MASERDALLAALRRLKPELEARFGVTALALFGSCAREEAGPQSDVDLVVSFRAPPSLFGLAELDDWLEARLGRRVDTVLEDGLHRAVRPQVERDRIAV